MYECAPGTLKEVIKASGNELKEAHVQIIGYQIIRGLHYLHSLGIVHRDINPENILAYNDLTIRLIDFGHCRNVYTADQRHTMETVAHAYRAP